MRINSAFDKQKETVRDKVKEINEKIKEEIDIVMDMPMTANMKDEVKALDKEVKIDINGTIGTFRDELHKKINVLDPKIKAMHENAMDAIRETEKTLPELVKT